MNTWPILRAKCINRKQDAVRTAARLFSRYIVVPARAATAAAKALADGYGQPKGIAGLGSGVSEG